MEIEDLEHFCYFIAGGECRYTLPGRGITIKTYYRPFAEVAAEAMTEAANQIAQAMNRMAEELPAALETLSKQLEAFLEAHPELKSGKEFPISERTER